MPSGDPRGSNDAVQELEELLHRARDILNKFKEGMRQDSLVARGERCLECIKVLDLMSTLSVSPEDQELLDTIVTVATLSIGAEAGSILLIDETGRHLSFAAVQGEKASQVKDFKLRMDQGIAGFVAMSGHPLCVENVEESEQWDRTIAEAIQFETRSILAVPVRSKSRVLGVLETVNKVGGGGFGQKDIEHLSLFAKIVGTAVEKQYAGTMQRSLLDAARRKLEDEALRGESRSALAAMGEAIKELQASGEYQQAHDLAQQILTLCSRSPQDARLCRRILDAFAARVSSLGSRWGLGGR